MDAITIIYLVYIFISFYFLFFFLLVYFPNKKKIKEIPKPNKNYSLTMVIPCFNEENDIEGTIKSLLAIKYEGLKKIIIVDDCSTDNSWKVIQEYAKKYDKIQAVQTPKNTGGAGGAKQYGSQFVDTDLIGFTDADSYPVADSIGKMVGFFNDPKTGAVSSTVLVKNRNGFLEKVQSIEYKIIAFTRKLLGFVEAIYVTPGPLAVYRKEAFDKVGGFDVKNMTEDIEITWAFVKAGYKIEMAMASSVYSVAPSTLKTWFKQRVRWGVGGIQTTFKYKRDFGNAKAGMLGKFILPLFVSSWLLGVVGIFIFGYRAARIIFQHYMSATYSVANEVAVVAFRDISLAPSILFFFGIATLIANIFLLYIALYHTSEKNYKRPNLISIGFYFVFYVLTHPIVMMAAAYKFLKGNYSWR